MAAEEKHRRVKAESASTKRKKRTPAQKPATAKASGGGKGEAGPGPRTPVVDEDPSVVLREAAPKLVKRLLKKTKKGDTRALLYALDHALGKPGKAARQQAAWQAPEVVRVEVPKDGGR